MFMMLLERVVVVEQALEQELDQSREIILHKTRTDAYRELCKLVADRGNLVNKVDLIQFSGSTAIPFLHALAKECPNASVRLLLYDRDAADRFDSPGYHRIRIEHTLTEVESIREEKPTLDIQVWFYDLEPSLAAVVIDNWAVSLGWYRIFPNSAAVAGISLRSHSDPGLTALDSEAEPLRSMVERQIEAVIDGRPCAALAQYAKETRLHSIESERRPPASERQPPSA